MKLSPLAQKWKDKYDKKWANADQIKVLLDHNFITQEEYDYIINSEPTRR